MYEKDACYIISKFSEEVKYFLYICFIVTKSPRSILEKAAGPTKAKYQGNPLPENSEENKSHKGA